MRKQNSNWGDKGGKKGKGLLKEQIQMDMDNWVGLACGSGGAGWGRGEQWGKTGTTVIEQQ